VRGREILLKRAARLCSGRGGGRMNTMQDLIDQIKVILPNALVVEADDEVVIQTGLVSDLGGLLYPIEREGESV